MTRAMLWLMSHYATVLKVVLVVAVAANLGAYSIAVALTTTASGEQAAASAIYGADLALVAIIFAVPGALWLWTRVGPTARWRLRGAGGQTMQIAEGSARECAVSVTRLDVASVEDSVREVYRLMGRRAPRIVTTMSPEAAIDLAQKHRLSGLADTNRWRTETISEEVAAGAMQGGLPHDVQCHLVATSAVVSAPLVEHLQAEGEVATALSLWDAPDISVLHYLDAVDGLRAEASALVRLHALAPLTLLLDDVAIVSQRPLIMTVDEDFVAHSMEEMPAMLWADGFMVWAWRGVAIPASAVLDTLPIDVASAIASPRVRHAAMECMGFDRFVHTDGFYLLDSAPDPGNGERILALYDVPQDMRCFGQRVLVGTNGTAEPDGSYRRYGLAVPARLDDAIAAAAWTYGMDREEYARAQRRA